MCQSSNQVIEMSYEDSAHKMRTLSITGIVDYLGIAYAQVTNEIGKVYFAVVDVFGSIGECDCKSTGVCYHLQALFSIVDQLPRYEEPEETTPVEEVMLAANIEMDIFIEQSIAKAEKINERKMANYLLEQNNVYAQVGATKQVSDGGDYDLCEGCQRKIKKGQRYCGRPTC